MTAIQQLILQCFVIEPEDPRAFELEQRRQHRAKNAGKFRAQARKLYARDPEKVRVACREWRKQNPQKMLLSARGWDKKNPEKVKENRCRRQRERRKNPEFRLLCNLRTRICMALKLNTKSAHTTQLIGCTILELRAHLEKQFRPGMTWENWGEVWHVDHKRPCVSFDLTDPAQQRECFHWSNQQPLFVEENLKKGGFYE